MEPTAKSQLVVPVNFDMKWCTPDGQEVKVGELQTRFETFQVSDDCADLDREWLEFARDHPDCADTEAYFLDPQLERLPKLPKGGYGVRLDLGSYKPECVVVKVSDGFVLVTASDRDRTVIGDGTAVKCWRKFERRFKLPDGMAPDQVITELTEDGWLKISVPVPGISSSVAMVSSSASSERTAVETDDSKSSIVDR